MLKFTGMKEDRPLVGLGLTDENLARLRSDEPIVVDTAELGMDDGPIIWLFAGGKDDVELAEILAKAGLIPPEAAKGPPLRPGEESVWRRDA